MKIKKLILLGIIKLCNLGLKHAPTIEEANEVTAYKNWALKELGTIV